MSAAGERFVRGKQAEAQRRSHEDVHTDESHETDTSKPKIGGRREATGSYRALRAAGTPKRPGRRNGPDRGNDKWKAVRKTELWRW